MTSGKHVHLIGVTGTGLSAIARVLIEQGYTVSGSDRSLSAAASELEAIGVRVFAGHAAEQVQGADVVVRSSAIPDDNVEVQAALAAGIPVLKRAQFLPELMAGKQTLAVAGTHGKTTTSAMLAWVLTRLGDDPSFIIGGVLKNLGRNAHAGAGSRFVIEADEYDRMFLGLKVDCAIITYVEHDHPDCYPTMGEYRQAFRTFVGQVQPGGAVFAAHENDEACALLSYLPADVRAIRYGLQQGADYVAQAVTPNRMGGFDYVLTCVSDLSLQLPVQLCVPGLHNVTNSVAVLALVHQQGADERRMQAAAQALAEFEGTGRRFEVRGAAHGVTVIDDYGHHPTAIAATLAAARARYPQARIWAVWQPHTFSRTQQLQAAFAQSFADADQVLVTEIYPSREKAADFGHYSAQSVVEQMQPGSARFSDGLQATTQILLQEAQPGDVVLVFSAGDAEQISGWLLTGLKSAEVSHD